MLIKELPSVIADLAIKEILKQKHEVTEESNILYSYILDWNKTSQGYDFWKLISMGTFTVFYEKYGKNVDTYSII